MSNLSDAPDARDQLDALVRQLGSTLAGLGWGAAPHHQALNRVGSAPPVCQSAAIEAESLAERLDGLSVHAELGVGEARAALAEAAAALHHQAGLKRTQASGLTRIMMAPGFQGPSGQVVEQMALIISHAEQQLQQLLAQSAHAQPPSSSSARSMPPDSIEIIACSRTAGLPW